MGEVSTIGVDIAKSVFQIHGVDAGGTVVIRRRVGRARVLEFFADLPPCLVGMEACATAHQWAREVNKESDRYATLALSVTHPCCFVTV